MYLEFIVFLLVSSLLPQDTNSKHVLLFGVVVHISKSCLFLFLLVWLVCLKLSQFEIQGKMQISLLQIGIITDHLLCILCAKTALVLAVPLYAIFCHYKFNFKVITTPPLLRSCLISFQSDCQLVSICSHVYSICEGMHPSVVCFSYLVERYPPPPCVSALSTD